ncbi:hypothetical protein PUNSTDRAFT_63690 [Punctularia strigosozonata HHB-11173 SS5]|uniref:uncharacterized protein n=1 Tax=Punctularia strigosozonata (strain HHB-11173) TaxID=741275 RepID=UPI0004417CEA|nr:uncharacterized protein PUNSTDRAFT_63690 [Punctularia strigosozonata HHB-11173 SS5]EIN11042.1 hypothetical protein PUNSTDRAFT_63690 [Punctularia strigosozonata HHB-11173 SS5]
MQQKLSTYRGFAQEMVRRTKLVEVDMRPNAEEPTRKEARVVCEVDVQDDMLNPHNVHGGCMATLIDNCTSLPLSVWNVAAGGPGTSGVSQSLAVWYHAPAPKGSRLRLISTTTAVGSRTMMVRCEVWDITHHRLVATGVHTKLEPSVSKSKL